MDIRRTSLAISCLLVFLSSARVPALGAEPELIAVLDLQGVQASAAEASALTDRLREELLRTQQFILVDRSQMESVLDEQALQQTGCTEQECAVQVGRILGVRKLVAGKVTKLSDKLWLVSGIMVDVETAQTLRAESVQHKGDLFGLLTDGIATLAYKLAGVESDSVPTARQAALRQPDQAPAEPTAGTVWREPITGMEFVYVPGGKYVQGCGQWTRDCFPDESPTRTVTVGPFWIGRTEVTQGQWTTIMGNNPSRFDKAEDFPVERVSWIDAQRFIQRLNERSDKRPFRLPTEAEWEYACRNRGRPVEYATQSGGLYQSDANFGLNVGFTSRVGSFNPNAIGLHDMSGNLWEWTLDSYAKDAYQADDVEDPIRSGQGDYRVARGGSWFDSRQFLRCTFRNKVVASTKSGDTGFRIVRKP